MNRKLQNVLIGVAVIVGALILMGTQLSRFAVDTSLGDWYDNAKGLELAFKEQQRTGKPVALFFHTDWCANCKKLRESVLTSTQFSQFSQQVISVKINPEVGFAEQQLAKKYNVIGYPTFLLISDNPRRVIPIRSAINANTEQFIKECRQSVELMG